MKNNFKETAQLCLDTYKKSLIEALNKNIEEIEKNLQSFSEQQLTKEGKNELLQKLIHQHFVSCTEDIVLPFWINEETFKTALKDYIERISNGK